MEISINCPHIIILEAGEDSNRKNTNILFRNFSKSTEAVVRPSMVVVG